MKILIVSPDLNPQAERIASELAKNSLHTEVIDQLHPLRLVFNQYDLIHFIEPGNPKSNKWQNLLTYFRQSLQTAFTHAIGLPTLVTLYDRSDSPNTLLELPNQFSALTASHIEQLKLHRKFQGEKMILPYLPVISRGLSHTLSEKNQNKIAFIIPVYKDFTDLLNYSKLHFQKILNCDFYIDARGLTFEMSHSQIRKEWTKFIKKNKDYAQFILFTSDEIFNSLKDSAPLYIALAKMCTTQKQFANWIECYLQNDINLILSEDQATGFSKYWKHQQNCFIIKDTSQLDSFENSLLDYINTKRLANETFDKISLFSQCIDAKINELTRLYTKIIQQKTSLNHRTSVKMEV